MVLDKYQMRIKEIIKEQQIAEFDYTKHKKLVIDHMKQAGYKKLGHGADALVFSKDAGTAIKIIIPQSGKFEAADNTFLAFYEYCKQHADNPHLPKFVAIGGQEHATFQLDGETFRQIAMERLKPIPPGSELDNAIFAMYRAARANEPMAPEYEQYSSFYETLKSVMETGTRLGFQNDIMSFDYSNVMLRGKTPVIMDPWTNK